MKPTVYLVLTDCVETKKSFALMVPGFTGLDSVAILSHPRNEPAIRSTLSEYFTIAEPTEAEWDAAMVTRDYRPLNMPLDHIGGRVERQAWLI